VLEGNFLGVEHQTFDAPAETDVLCQDFFNIFRGSIRVPNPFRIDHERGSVLAHVEATGAVDPDPAPTASHNPPAHAI
jgi:hypothetical protein